MDPSSSFVPLVSMMCTEDVGFRLFALIRYTNLLCCGPQDTPWLDGAHVVFGKVTDGLDVIDKIEEIGSQSGATSKSVVVKDCGEL